MFITSSGNVGIGTTAPGAGYKLDVNGEINATGLRIGGTPIGSSQWSSGSGSISYNSGNVGIGVTNPLAKLDVAGPIRANNHLTLLPWTNLGTAPQGPWVPGYAKLSTPIVQTEENMFSIKIKGYRYGSSASLEIRCGGYAFGGSGLIHSECFTEVTSDPVGIGVENNKVVITIGSASSGGTWYYDHFTAEYSGWTAKDPNDFSWQFVYNADPTTTNTNQVIVNDSAGTITTTGNVGIGTASPGQRLDVNGFIRGSNASANGIVLGSSSNPINQAIVFPNGYALYDTGPNISFRNSAGSTLLAMQTDGNVGIGTTTPTQKLHVAGNINVTATATEAGNINIAGTINAKYQDVAEWVPSSEQLAPGTVVVLDSTKSNQVIASTVGYDTRVAGVISAQPGIALGEKGEGKVLVATTGRVKIKVDASKSPIQIGDLLVTSDIPGVAMKSEAVNLGGVQFHRPGTLIGKALEPLTKGSGEILVLLSLQ